MKRGIKKWKLNSTAKIMKSVLICGDEYIYIYAKDMEDTMNKIKCFLNKRKLISKNTRVPWPGIQNEQRSWRTLITWQPLLRRVQLNHMDENKFKRFMLRD